MIRTEDMIISQWNRDKATVSIICATYNHENYIEDCINSFLEQDTDFPFEVYIHDDCSKDNTPGILKKYQELYPNIIKPLFATENRFSRKIDIYGDIVFPLCKGKYIAFCEGDDRWCDPKKLQLQYDFMENNSEYVMCVHNTFKHDLISGDEERLYQCDKSHRLEWNEVFFGWNVHTSSYFMRNELVKLPKELVCACGDFVWLTRAYCNGGIWFFSEVMSIYNYNNKSGVTYINGQDLNKAADFEISRNNCLKTLNELTDFEYNDIISKRVQYNNIFIKLLLINGRCSFSCYRDLKTTVKENIMGVEFFDERAQKSLKNKISNYMFFLIYQVGRYVLNRMRA